MRAPVRYSQVGEVSARALTSGRVLLARITQISPTPPGNAFYFSIGAIPVMDNDSGGHPHAVVHECCCSPSAPALAYVAYGPPSIQCPTNRRAGPVAETFWRCKCGGLTASPKLYGTTEVAGWRRRRNFLAPQRWSLK